MGNDAICSCNFKQEQKEENFHQFAVSNTKSHSQTQDINQVGKSRSSNVYSSNMSDLNQSPAANLISFQSITDEVKLTQKQSDLYSSYLKNLTKNKYSNKKVFNKQQFVKILKLQSALKRFLKRKNSKNLKVIHNSHSKSKNRLNYNKDRVNMLNINDAYITYFKVVDHNTSDEDVKNFGVQIWKDGAVYKGEFKYIKNEDEWSKSENTTNVESLTYKAHGLGIFTHSEGDIYQGEFINDETNGYGFYTHLNGAIYEGNWYQDSQNGIGIEYWSDGSYFEGIYINGTKDGIGSYFWADGSQYYGEWKDNNLEGYGIYKFSDGRIYSGEWLNNSMHGYGDFIWQDGKKYRGFYENDKKSGFGIYLWVSPIRLYVGFWKNGKQAGVGKYISNKSIYWGIWDNGSKVKKLDTNEDVENQLTESEKIYLPIMNMTPESLIDIILSKESEIF